MKKYQLYDVCYCNHEFLQHGPECSAIVPVGKDGYRGWVAPETPSKSCSCQKFKFNSKNTANIAPSER